MRNPSITALWKSLLVSVFYFTLTVTTAHAVQLGQIVTHSKIGEPIDSTVGLWLSPKERGENIRFKLLPDFADRHNAAMEEIVGQMEARLEYSASGNPYVRLSTSAPQTEPVVAFRLKVYVGEMAVSRNFTVLPRLTANAQQAPAAPTASRTPAKKRAYSTKPAAVTPIAGSTYTVSGGDTLWGLARRASAGSGDTVASMVERIFVANPHAFVDGNKNALKLGAVLTLPAVVAEQTSVTALAGSAPADGPIRTESTPTETDIAPTLAGSAEPASESSADIANATVPVSDAAAMVTNDEPVMSDERLEAVEDAAGGTSTRTVDWRERKPEKAAELDAIARKFDELRDKYGDQGSTSPAISAEPEDTSAANQTITPEATAATPSPGAVETTNDTRVTETVADNAVANHAQEQAVEQQRVGVATETPVQLEWKTWSLVAVATFALLILVIGKLLNTQGGPRPRLQHAKGGIRSRSAELLQKTRSKLEFERHAVRTLELNVSELLPDGPPNEEGNAVGDLDPAIDSSIAHGRYAEAEKLLRDVVADSPRNHAAKLRLIEVYYMTEQVDKFCEIAEDLHANHRSDMTDEEWRRVVRMGKIFAPDRMPFGGPRAVDSASNVS